MVDLICKLGECWGGCLLYHNRSKVVDLICKLGEFGGGGCLLYHNRSKMVDLICKLGECWGVVSCIITDLRWLT